MASGTSPTPTGGVRQTSGGGLSIPGPRGRSRRILLVDKEDAYRRKAARALSDWGHWTVEARTLTEALNVFASSTPDVVLVDLALPDNAAEVLFCRARATLELAHVPFLFTGRSILRKEITRGVPLEEGAFLKKPYSFRGFLDWCVPLFRRLESLDGVGTPGGFQGTLLDLEVSDLFCAVELFRRTGELRLSSARSAGEALAVFHEGQLLSVTWDGLSGRDALLEVTLWKEASYSFVALEVTPGTSSAEELEERRELTDLIMLLDGGRLNPFPFSRKRPPPDESGVLELRTAVEALSSELTAGRASGLELVSAGPEVLARPDDVPGTGKLPREGAGRKGGPEEGPGQGAIEQAPTRPSDLDSRAEVGLDEDFRRLEHDLAELASDEAGLDLEEGALELGGSGAEELGPVPLEAQPAALDEQAGSASRDAGVQTGLDEELDLEDEEPLTDEEPLADGPPPPRGDDDVELDAPVLDGWLDERLEDSLDLSDLHDEFDTVPADMGFVFEESEGLDRLLEGVERIDDLAILALTGPLPTPSREEVVARLLGRRRGVPDVVSMSETLRGALCRVRGIFLVLHRDGRVLACTAPDEQARAQLGRLAGFLLRLEDRTAGLSDRGWMEHVVAGYQRSHLVIMRVVDDVSLVCFAPRDVRLGSLLVECQRLTGELVPLFQRSSLST